MCPFVNGSELFSAQHGSLTLRPQDTSARKHFSTIKSVPKFKRNHRWSCVSSELSWVEVSRLFLDHGTRVEMSRTTFLVSNCLEIGAEVSQSVLMPKCPVTLNIDVDISGLDLKITVELEAHRKARQRQD